MTAPARAAPRSPFRIRNFSLLWGGGLVSDLGDWMLLVALPVYVFQLTGSALITSSVFVVELVPALLVGQLAGVLVDRWDRRRILVVSGVIQAVLLLPLLAATTVDSLWIIYLVAAVQSCLARLCGPAKAAMIPAIVPAEQVAAANALNAVSDNLARLVGSPLGGLAIQFFGLVGVVVIDAATYLVSALLTAGVRPPKAPAPIPAAAVGRPSLLDDWLDGLRTIRRTPRCRPCSSSGRSAKSPRGCSSSCSLSSSSSVSMAAAGTWG